MEKKTKGRGVMGTPIQTTDELLRRLADARDLNVSERERENLCAAAHTEITRLVKETLDLQAALEEAQQSTDYFRAHYERLVKVKHGEE